MDLDPLHLVFYVMGLHLYALVELCDTLRLVDYSFGFVLALLQVFLLHVVLLLAFFTHC